MSTSVIDYYKKGFIDAIELMELMGQDDGFDEWSAMIAEAKRFIEEKK